MTAPAAPKLSAQPKRRIVLPASGWEPRVHQRPFWDYLEAGGKRAIEIAHRRWGKDDVTLHRTAVAAHERVATYWHMLPEYAQARKAIWDAVNPHTGKRRIDEAFPKELRANTVADEMFIRFKCGSTWQVIGSDNYDKLVGTPPAGVVLSEWSRANPAAWAFLAPILAENGGWAAFITTPIGRNHAKTMYDMAKTDPAWFAEVSTVEDTKAIPLSVIEGQRGSITRSTARKPATR
jgi:phage terminase large subunit